MPKGYSKELPRLAQGPSTGLPRVYDIALETIAHGDGRVDPESLRLFLTAYQRVSPLKLGELWAIPIMLRLALIENLRRVAVQLAASRARRNLADAWADQMIETAEKDPVNLILLVADMARSEPPMFGSFVAELARRLQGHGPALTLPLTWIAQHLSEAGTTIEQLINLETQQQAADQVSISNSIGSLRFLSNMDWRDFVEAMSNVEQSLRAERAGIYSYMDFATRDRYRHVIEAIARYSEMSEAEIAAKAVGFANEAAASKGIDARTAHVGYYLVGEGRPLLERAVSLRLPLKQSLQAIGARSPLAFYLGTTFLLTAVFTAEMAGQAYLDGVPIWLVAILVLISMLASSHLAHALVNWFATILVKPRPLPRMDFTKGIPADMRTLVVVPTLLFNKPGIDSLCEALEVRFLANRDDNLHFCLLTDFSDAPAESMPEDEELLAHASAGIERLNQKYRAESSKTAGSAFFLLHRPRRWNPQQRTWMGHERKRGKLADLNALILTGSSQAFSCMVGPIDALAGVKYVITLDTDTQLPRDSARQFIASMAHPLNHPRHDDKTGVVREGHGILQPRVAVSLPSSRASHYELLFGGEAGIDPYTRAVSDVYQDVFDEGSFIGKGIYSVAAFERALDAKFPENQILSHDLLEGCYTRSGLISDAQLYEEYPSKYSADVARRHRWIRGDWQLLPWLFSTVPTAPAAKDSEREPSKHRESGRMKNPLTALSRWKLFDNLRRSLVSTALVVLLVLSWTLLPNLAFWTGSVLGILFLPSVLAVLQNLFDKSHDMLWRQHLVAALRSGRQHFYGVMVNLAFLPYEASYSLDAIARTLWRMLVSRKNMLEWNPSSVASRSSGSDLSSSLRAMWISPLIAVATACGLLWHRPLALLLAAPFLLAWIVAPAIAWWISRPLEHNEEKLSTDQTEYLYRIARKTWAFFETYVGPDDHWLPPDNYQEQPVAVLARRTSPTNIGLSLLSGMTACDFGYIVPGQLIERTANTMRTMAKLERHRGHFYNWYDTSTLAPLHPIYISTVDSGNLAGHLMVLRTGLLAIIGQPIVGPRQFEGIGDTFRVLLHVRREAQQDPAKAPIATAQARPKRECARAEASDRRAKSDRRDLIDNDLLTKFQDYLDIARTAHDGVASMTPASCFSLLEKMAECARSYCASPESAADGQLNWWATALARQCQAAADELLLLAPWCNAPIPDQWDASAPDLTVLPTLQALAGYEAQLHALAPVAGDASGASVLSESGSSLQALKQLVALGSRRASERISAIKELALQAAEFSQMEYDFLYDKTTNLLAIGYNYSDHRRDQSYYDLLASEARLASFVAIAQGQVPQENWFAMGRQLTIAGSEPILLSWSGSMFEYLMPMLVMPNFPNTLLDQTCKAAVHRQIDYGAERKIPWGISESAYHTFDARLNYQYRAFGVPGLGLKRGLGDDLVVAPYATMLALMVSPLQACVNLQRLSAEGFEGAFGMVESIDYTAARLPRGQNFAIIKAFMAHHQGMGFLSLAYCLLDRPMQKRFEADPLFQATMLLLQERIPKAVAAYANTSELADIRITSGEPQMPTRLLNRADTRIPEVQLLSNGRYHLMVSNAGGGSSRWTGSHWKDLSVTRWREDGTRDNWGSFCYVRDMADGEFWSTAYQPTRRQPDSYEAIFNEGRVEFRRRDKGIDLHTEIVVSPEDDIELRRTHIRNRSRVRRKFDITSYCEVVLAPAAADSSHPAFSNLFIQTEIVKDKTAILCTRRPRSLGEPMPWMFTLMVTRAPTNGEDAGATVGEVSYETDRMKFIGRGRDVSAPAAMLNSAPLSGSQGSVLDPISAIRYQITLEPEQTLVLDMVTGIADSREAACHLIDKYQDRHLADRVFELAWTHSQVVLHQLNASEADAQLYARLAGSVIYSNPLLRADASILIKNRRGQSGLWSYAISGDLPIVLVQIRDVALIELVRQMVQAHAYWRMKGLAVDLVIWNEDHASYRQLLQDQIMGLIASGIEAHAIDRPGGIFVRLADQMSDEDRILLQAVARVVLCDNRGSLAEQINRRGAQELRVPMLVPVRAAFPADTAAGASGDSAADLKVEFADASSGKLAAQRYATANSLMLFNGIGGFAPDGREYAIHTTAANMTPEPWSNVLANPHFGSVISESGQAYTWGENAHEFRLTPWNNDSVCDAGGEAFYLRDEDTGQFWSPSPFPARGQGAYVSRHGFGYSVFEHAEIGIASEMLVYIALDAAIKYVVLKVRNRSSLTRNLSATGYVEWVLGDLRTKTGMHVVTEADAVSGAIFAHNAYNTDTDRIAFFDVDSGTRTVTGDRTEFIGRNGSLRNPAALLRARLSGKVGAGLDPCAAIQVPFVLAPGQEREIVFMLGVAGRRSADVSNLVQRYRGAVAARHALDAVHRHWTHTLGAVQISTPDQALNVLANGWLMYQTIACRLWARSGYYQSGGAYGFRDQLQDVMAMIYSEPHLVREHLLRCAAHQFVDGDVQHWWHPPTNRGVRTLCSDDYLWLPLAVSRYVTSSGDFGVLNEIVPFIEGRQLNEGEDSYYDLPGHSSQSSTLYQHCVLAILRGLRFGVHDLPLIGSCDWNDGMDKVGAEGKGESVWLAFFLYDVLIRFSKMASLHGDAAFAERCVNDAAALQKAIEKNGWDGEWYRRAYFDDGTPLGSASNPECQIDSLSQSWAVLSGAGDLTRARNAMEQVDRRLVRRDHGLIQLLDPPFSNSDLNPGYIRGYVPGVRENGGQYTHAAIWTAMAFAKLGDGERAWELLRMINPINHGRTPEQVAVYRVEPYVVAADVYAVAPHVGRGGWSWYTGSSGWMYRLIVESLLGLKLEADRLSVAPCLPADWTSFRLAYRYHQTTYNIVVRRAADSAEQPGVSVDGVEQPDGMIAMLDDRETHAVEVRVGANVAVVLSKAGDERESPTPSDAGMSY
ncbi:hypothetical protein BH11PSE11_BH11PSE11_18230 [soil metagenome]